MDNEAEIERHLPKDALFVVYYDHNWGTFVHPCSSWTKAAQLTASIFDEDNEKDIAEVIKDGRLIFSQPTPVNFYDIVEIWRNFIANDETYHLHYQVLHQDDILDTMSSLVNISVGEYVGYSIYNGRYRGDANQSFFYFTDNQFPSNYVYPSREHQNFILDTSLPIIKGNYTTYYFSNREQAAKAYHLLTKGGY